MTEALVAAFYKALADGDEMYCKYWAKLAESYSGDLKITSVNRQITSLHLAGGSFKNFEIQTGRIQKVHISDMIVDQIAISKCDALSEIWLEGCNVNRCVDFSPSKRTPASIACVGKAEEIHIGGILVRDSGSTCVTNGIHLDKCRVGKIELKGGALKCFEATSTHFSDLKGLADVAVVTSKMEFRKCSFADDLKIKSLPLEGLSIRECRMEGDFSCEIDMGSITESEISFADVKSLKVTGIAKRSFSAAGISLNGENVQCEFTLGTDGDLPLQLFGRIQQLRIGSANAIASKVAVFAQESAVLQMVELTNLKANQVEFSVPYLMSMNFNIVEVFDLLSIHKTRIDSLKTQGLKCHGTSRFSTCVFTTVPDFRGDTPFRHYDVRFEQCRFEDKRYQSQSAYRRLKHIMNEVGNEPDEMRFGSHEILCRIQEWSDHRVETFFGRVYNVINKCGLDVIRPIYLLFAIVVGGCLLDIAFNCSSHEKRLQDLDLVS